MKSRLANPLDTLINTPLSIYQSRKESERFYTGVFNTVAQALPLAGEPVVTKKFGDIGPAIEEYDRRFYAALESGEATPEQIFSLRQCSSILKKLELPVFEKEAKKRCLEKWYDSEAACKEINEQLIGLIDGHTPVPAELKTITEGIKKEILTLIGEVPPDLPDVIGGGRFGPGASSCCPRKFRHPLFQFNSLTAFYGMEIEVQWILRNTLLAEAEASGYYGMEYIPPYVNDWRKVYSRVTFVDHERYEDAPKSIENKRSIGVGPNLATFVAQAYDQELRSRLLNWGIDLTDQEPNRYLAYIGSLNGDDCTLDLTEASNRVSLGLVYACLPVAWFRVLYPLRAKTCLMPSSPKRESVVRLEKFSSMGNSLTFSIMTLIISALIRSLLRDRGLKNQRWRVYGDDVIVPKVIYSDVIHRLSLIGLKVNEAKSFSEFSFRESCGRDYFAGVNVRPLYIKKPVRFVTDLYKYINLAQVVEERCPIMFGVLGSLREFLIRWIPSSLRVWGEPSRYLDRYIWGPFKSGRPSFMVVGGTPSGSPANKQAYFMRLYSGGKVESYVQDGRGEKKKSHLYPDSRVLVTNDDTVFYSLKRKPGRKVWENLSIDRFGVWDE
jgi:hypothetical protein